MLKLQPIEFLLRGIPESFLFILAIYVFSKTKLDKNKYIISSLLYATSTYIIRLLPIDYGVHMILSVLFLLFILIIYNKFEVIVSIRSIIIMYLIQFVSEAINVAMLNMIGLDLDTLFKNPVNKSVIGIPSLIISGIIIWSFNFLNKKREKKECI